ncbi:LytR/AlgR family response regulator transcription factor [Neolewinella persica]|uniref:LytR/AlgR family response regulator transcription factor n=1 Tax=Neolewinella persica TaxID=70998 RepID=UPI00037FCE22|nr:LytTR family DNA-binding domain-containing protein [Neolewinella persica]
MTHRCLIIDDEDLARELITSHLEKLPEFTLVGTCASALEARQILQTRTVDLLFLDIEMPVLKGTEFLKSLRHPPKVIFTTAYRNYAIDGFNLNAVDYLLKPITFERFYQSTSKYLEQFQTSRAESPVSSRRDHIFIRKDRKQIKLELSDIQYVESLKDYIKIVADHETHTIKHRLTAFLELLDDRFLQVHRSFLVNLDRVTAYTKQDIEIGAKELPIGELYKEVVIEKLA